MLGFIAASLRILEGQATLGTGDTILILVQGL